MKRKDSVEIMSNPVHSFHIIILELELVNKEYETSENDYDFFSMNIYSCGQVVFSSPVLFVSGRIPDLCCL